jgi:hypothetical protein
MFTGRVYIIGGVVLSKDAMSTVELYSPTTGGTILPYPLAIPDYDFSAVTIV